MLDKFTWLTGDFITTWRGIFRRKYSLKGKRWLRTIPPEDRLVFSQIGLMALRAKDINIHKLGGKARAELAQRDHRGRFIKG